MTYIHADSSVSSSVSFCNVRNHCTSPLSLSLAVSLQDAVESVEDAKVMNRQTQGRACMYTSGIALSLYL